MTNNNQNLADNMTKYDELSLYLMLWHDVIDRIDTVLLELRHLQKNIIYHLHAPFLYAPLKHEDQYIWGDEGWGNVEKRTEIEKLVTKWVQNYPTARSGSNKKNDGQNSTDEAINEFECNVENHKTRWNNDQRALYYNLHLLQCIKRTIVRDKLEICFFAAKLPFNNNNYIENHSATSTALSKFLLIRSVISARLRDHVKTLGDLQMTFIHSQDFGLYDHPRPNSNRHRDQHMYNVHLADRCRDISREMVLLLEHLNVCKYNDHRLVIHRWKREFSSNTYSVSTEISGNKINYHHIMTSYWMPERPDLQSVIAHEVAHGVLKERLDNMSFETLDAKGDNSFSIMIKLLDQCISLFRDDMPSDYHPSPLIEISADLLATVIEGPSYLYALFVDMIGFGLEELFLCNSHLEQYDLDIIDYIDHSIGKNDLVRDWYYRIHIVCTWLESICPNKQTDKHILTRRLIISVRSITEALHNYIESNTPHDRSTHVFWKTYQSRLCEILSESTSVTKSIRSWMEDREEDSSKPECHNYPRSSMGLREDVRKLLVDGLFEKKYVRNRQDNNLTKDQQIADVYCLKNQETTYIALFQKLQDISWQSAMLRGLDIVHPNSIYKPCKKKNGEEELSTLIRELHEHVPLGRDLYPLALDFYVHNMDSAWQRLVEAINLLNEINSWDDNNNSEINIKKWDKNNKDNSIKSLYDHLIKKCHHNKIHNDICWDVTAKKYPASIIARESDIWALADDKYQQYPDVRLSQLVRRLGRVQGRKLHLLFKILEEMKKNDVDNNKTNMIHPLYSLLKIRDNTHATASDNNKTGFLYRLLKIRGTHATGGNNNRTLDTSTELSDRENLINAFKNSSGLSKTPGNAASCAIASQRLLTRICYSSLHRKKITFSPEKNDSTEIFQFVTGRFDAITIRVVSPMARCKLTSGYGSDDDHTPFGDNLNLNNIIKNLSPTYFVRRELVTPVRLGKKAWSADAESSEESMYLNERDCMALLVLNLKRAGSRLDVIYRLGTCTN